MPRTKRYARVVAGLVVVAVVMTATDVGVPPPGAAQEQGTPPSDPCGVVRARGTPGAEHAPPGRSAFDPGSPEQAGETGDAAGYPFDLVFIDAMLAHHDGAVAMAEIALVASERAEIRDLAAGIVAAQGAEIDTLRAWRADWYPGEDPVPANVATGLTDEGMMTAGAMGGMGQGSVSSDLDRALARLCAQDGPFDLAFLSEMVPHHQGAAGMARLAVDRAEHPEVGGLAAEIAVDREAEIALMTAWQAEWYPPGAAGSSGEADGTIEGTPTV